MHAAPLPVADQTRRSLNHGWVSCTSHALFEIVNDLRGRMNALPERIDALHPRVSARFERINALFERINAL